MLNAYEHKFSHLSLSLLLHDRIRLVDHSDFLGTVRHFGVNCERLAGVADLVEACGHGTA
jgi:hypothetical protein